MQNTNLLRKRESEKLTPNDKHVGNAGGTDIVTKSKHLMTTSSTAMSSKSTFSMNVDRETKKQIIATLPRMRMNFPESFLNEI